MVLTLVIVSQAGHFIALAKDRNWLVQNEENISLSITDEWHDYSPMIQCEIVRRIIGLCMPLRDVSHDHITTIVGELNRARFTRHSLPDGYTAIISPFQLRIESRASNDQCTTLFESINVSYSKVRRPVVTI